MILVMRKEGLTSRGGHDESLLVVGRMRLVLLLLPEQESDGLPGEGVVRGVCGRRWQLPELQPRHDLKLDHLDPQLSDAVFRVGRGGEQQPRAAEEEDGQQTHLRDEY